MKCYNECGKEAIEGKYFCSLDCKKIWVKKTYGVGSPTRIRKLTVSEMRAEMKTWGKKKPKDDVEDIFLK